MENPEDKHLLSQIWENFAGEDKSKALTKPFIEKIIGEIFLNYILFIAAANDELINTIITICLHYMP